MPGRGTTIEKYFRRMSAGEAERHRGGYGLLTNLVTEGVSPYVAYSFLKSHFGVPQYKVKTLAEYDKVQWEYFIKGKNSYLRVYDWKLFDWSIGIARPPISSSPISPSIPASPQEEKTALSDAKLLFSYIKRYARTAAHVPVGTHRYQLVENVFQTNYSRGQQLLELMATTTDYYSLSAMAWAAAVSYIFSVEGLLNLVYDIYLHKTIRENTELQQHLQRLPLTDKWGLASYMCYCFARPLKNNSLGYQSLKKLTNLRNEWAHSAITPEMRTFFLREDNLSFAATSARAVQHFDILGKETDFVKQIRQDADTIVSEMVQAVRPELKTTFLKVLRHEAISLDAERMPLRGPRHYYWP
jgi:hypothetical protein